VPPNAALADPEHARDLGVSLVGEEAQFHDLRRDLVVLGQLRERLIQVDEIGLQAVGFDQETGESLAFLSSSTLQPAVGARRVDENSADKTPGDREEVCAPLLVVG
jgi:hypothetical protein